MSSNDVLQKTQNSPLLSDAAQDFPRYNGDENLTGAPLVRSNWIRASLVVAVIVIVMLSGLTSLHSPRRAKEVSDQLEFPEHFVWGSATSSYQIEGATNEDGRGVSIWDTYCKNPANCNGDTADVACDHYHRVDSDVKLMKSLGLKAYRFSIAWPRIFPQGSGKVNNEGIAFYNTLIDTLLANDIEPWVTLYHWDLPQALEDEYGGWLGREIVDDFGDYARACFEAFGDRVTHWITMNESWTVAIHGYDEGTKAPGHSDQTATEPYIVAHHLILAHARAVQIYRSEFAPQQAGIIGIANCGDFRYPRQQDKKADKEAAERAMEFQIAWFADPIWKGDYPESMQNILGSRLPQFTDEERSEILGSSDFFGLNHYSTLLAAQPQVRRTGEYWADMFVESSDDPQWEHNCMGWNVVPDGCRSLLKWIDERYDRPPIYMTENGSCEDEDDLDTALHDYKRRDYFERYLRACAEAIQAGVDLRGYFAWSLMDNFEWQFGFSRRFGICRVDFETLERTPKLTATWYRDTIAMNGRNIQLNN